MLNLLRLFLSSTEDRWHARYMIVQCLDFSASAEPQLAELKRQAKAAINFDVAEALFPARISNSKCQFYARCTVSSREALIAHLLD
jgi:hypothetical protein